MSNRLLSLNTVAERLGCEPETALAHLRSVGAKIFASGHGNGRRYRISEAELSRVRPDTNAALVAEFHAKIGEVNSAISALNDRICALESR